MESQQSKSCGSCKNYHFYRESESWEMDHIFWYVRICDAKPNIVNLKQFPFSKTKCDKYESHKVRAAASIGEQMK